MSLDMTRFGLGFFRLDSRFSRARKKGGIFEITGWAVVGLAQHLGVIVRKAPPDDEGVVKVFLRFIQPHSRPNGAETALQAGRLSRFRIRRIAGCRVIVIRQMRFAQQPLVIRMRMFPAKIVIGIASQRSYPHRSGGSMGGIEVSGSMLKGDMTLALHHP